jgi:cytochrome P450
MMNATAESNNDIPPHVPHDLVRPFPFVFGALLTENPFDRIIPEMHEGPDIFFARNVFAGGVPGWVFTRAADLRRIYLDTEHFSSLSMSAWADSVGEDWRLVPSEMDPPEHTLYRKMLNPLFELKMVNRLTERIKLYASEQIRSIASKGEAEFISEFAQPFPVKVFLELMGLPQDMRSQFLTWGHGLMHPSGEEMLRGCTRAASSYLRGEIARRRTNPGEDIISYGINVEVDGKRLSDDDLFGFLFGLFLAGLDTVSTALAFQILHLARKSGDQETLRQHPEMIPDAVDEFMRAFGPAITFRTCSKQIELRGVTIMPGDKVVMFTSLAGRDPLEYERPNEVILTRKPRHLSFAYGAHSCAGMHLARLEMRTALGVVLSTLPTFRLNPNAQVKYSGHLVMQADHLPLEWAVAKH